MKTLTINIVGLRQGVQYLEVLHELPRLPDQHPHPLRIDIVTDSYKFQGHARIERWDGVQWRELHRITPEAMQSHVRERPSADKDARMAFAHDRYELLTVGLCILGYHESAAEQLAEERAS